MDDMMKRVVVIGLILSLIFVGMALAVILKSYQMNGVSQKMNLRLYFNPDVAESHVIILNGFNWTAATGVLIGNGTVLNMWARNEGNLPGNFSFQIYNPVNCSVVIAPQALPINMLPGQVENVTLTLSNVLDDPSWQIIVNY